MFGLQSIIYEDHIITPLLERTKPNGVVSLIRIPPPRTPNSRNNNHSNNFSDINDEDLIEKANEDNITITDISNWHIHDDSETVWRGNFKFLEIEKLDQSEIYGVLELIGFDGGEFASIKESDESLKSSINPRYYKIIIEYEEKKIALGLRFDDKEDGSIFNLALQKFKRDKQNWFDNFREIEDHNVINDLSSAIGGIHLNGEVDETIENVTELGEEDDEDEDEVDQQEEEVDDDKVNDNDDDDDDGDEFGDFIAG
ncbi:hypothetical protein WICMUC_004703 [Wickerhamomyces mucosus]|uniref:NECAP PHear domain-containing protein n=1 Tax=Wickerhamomyces mucosus TaxID=1378264 RepID=A0A9P8TAS5_9ASCO|nr:hypothetical protein WICMUC_004703 [Wickerhamomyces mucosus]